MKAAGNGRIERVHTAESKKDSAVKLSDIRIRTGMNMTQFSEWLGVPYRTFQDWTRAESKIPDYLLNLIEYKVQHEFDANSFNQQTLSAASFGLRLKEARIGCGMRQEDAAEIMGISRPTLSAIEAGKRQVTAEDIVRFADLYNVSAMQLLYDRVPEQIHDKESVLGNLKQKRMELEQTAPQKHINKQKEASR